MTFDSYLLFVFASVILCIVPGPDMIFLLGRTIAQGRKAGILAAVGINLGAYVHLLGVVLGVSAILATSAYAFTILKWAGAIYLIYIGVQTIFSKQGALSVDATQSKQLSMRAIFLQGFLSDVLNPKVAIFFLAFLPQFIAPEADGRILQIIFLGVTVNIIAITINILLVLFASTLTARLRKNQKISLWLNKLMGSIFIALGVKLANEKIN
jgi:threonine/homoserine/homoserine lactone efflux protein